MTPNTFYKQLAMVSAIVAVVLALLNTQDLFASHQSFSWISWGFFILFCLVVFFLSSLSAKSENKSLFGQVFLLSIFFKILLCALLIIVYALVGNPQNKFFVIPFAIIYFAFTTYKVYFVTKLAKQ